MGELIRRNSSGKLIPTIMVSPMPETEEEKHGADYYGVGNKELSTETALTVNRLEPVSPTGEDVLACCCTFMISLFRLLTLHLVR